MNLGNIFCGGSIGGVPVSPVPAEMHGGPGSGNFGHAGRPGEVGGSAEDGGGGGGGSTSKPVQRGELVAVVKRAMMRL